MPLPEPANPASPRVVTTMALMSESLGLRIGDDNRLMLHVTVGNLVREFPLHVASGYVCLGTEERRETRIP